jgi:hypothetical protein
MIPRARLLTLIGALAIAACHGGKEAEAPAPTFTAAAERGPVIHFAFEAVDQRPISTEALAGRVTVIGFVATYDNASLLQARHLAELGRRHVPRLNVAVIALDPPENRPIVEAFARAMPYPVAQADADTIAGRGPFAGLHHVPSVVILDRDGREAWRRIGLTDHAALETALRKVEEPPR